MAAACAQLGPSAEWTGSMCLHTRPYAILRMVRMAGLGSDGCCLRSSRSRGSVDRLSWMLSSTCMPEVLLIPPPLSSRMP